MEGSYFTTPPGQHATPSTTAPTSTSSTAVGCATPRICAPEARPPSPASFLDPSNVSPPANGNWKSSKSSPHSVSCYSICSRLPRRYRPGIWRWLLVLIALFVSLELYLHLSPNDGHLLSHLSLGWGSGATDYHIGSKTKHNPFKWLKDNSYPNDLRAKRPKAALISLVRNEELNGILQSMQQLEFHWNNRYNYPWVFFNEKPFSDEFKVGLFKLV